MKITKLVANPIHAGRLYIDQEVTVVDEVSEEDRVFLLQYEAEGSVRLEDDKPEAIRQSIKEEAGVPVEVVESAAVPKKKPATKKPATKKPAAKKSVVKPSNGE